MKDTATFVEREIMEAKIYYGLRLDLVTPLCQNQEFWRLAPIPILYMAQAFDSMCVLALAKVFAEDREPGLDRLVQAAKDVSVEVAEANHSEVVKSKKIRDVLKDRFNGNRATFLRNADSYPKQIREIREKLNPLRNIQRAHNFPERAERTERSWLEVREWLAFAERVYGAAMWASGEGSSAEVRFLPVTFDADVQHMLSVIYEGLSSKACVH